MFGSPMVMCSVSTAESSSKAVIALHIENSCWQKRPRVSPATADGSAVSSCWRTPGSAQRPCLQAQPSAGSAESDGPRRAAWTTAWTQCRALSCSGPLPEDDSLNDCLVSDMPECIDCFLNAKKPPSFPAFFFSPLGGKCKVQ